MFTALDTLMAAQLPQMELYCEIGRLVSRRSEKGAAVAASEYLQAAYPTAEGFSPRNVRRMRVFYAAYEESSEIMQLAMNLGWTQNVAILERCGSNEERAWYIRAVLHFGWKKAKLLAAIESQAWLHSSLDEQALSCYTEEKEVFQESESDEENTLCVPWKYLPQSDDRVRDEGLGHHLFPFQDCRYARGCFPGRGVLFLRDEGLGQEGWAGVTISYRIGGHQPGGDRQPSLSSSASQVGRTWDLLRRSHSTADHQCRLREVRFSDWHGQSQPPGYVPHLRRQFNEKR